MRTTIDAHRLLGMVAGAHIMHRTLIAVSVFSLAAGAWLTCLPFASAAEPAVVRLKLLDAITGAAVASVDVETYSDTGFRCIAAPCDTGGVTWNGKSDAAGYVQLPASFIKAVTSVRTPGRGGELITPTEGGTDRAYPSWSSSRTTSIPADRWISACGPSG